MTPSANNENKFRFTHDLFNRYKSEYDHLIGKDKLIDKGFVRLAEVARVRVGGKEYVLTPEGDKGTVLAARPGEDKGSPAVTLALDKEGALVVDVTYPKDAKPKDVPCTIVSAELIRLIPREGTPIRQELLRVRTLAP
jgi:hypothetical protein